MIGYLRGKLIYKKPPLLVMDVGGVGYEVNASMNTIYKLGEINSDVALYIHMAVREDAMVLFGFYTEEERLLFREIIKTSGIGPKLGLTILSGMDVKTFCECVQQKNHTRLSGLPGLGKKTAEKLIVEMQDRLAKTFAKHMNYSDMLFNNKDSYNLDEQLQQDAIDALVSLGYKPQNALKAVMKHSNSCDNSESLIKAALKEFATS